MSGSREIRRKIGSIRNTRKVTRALEMVSSSKIRRVQGRMEASRPYARMIRQVAGHLAHATPEYQHPFTRRHDSIDRVGYMVISSDRGLCGGLNINLFRQLLARAREHGAENQQISLAVVGRKAAQFFRRIKVDIPAAVDGLSEHPRVDELVGPLKVMLDAYVEERIDQLFVAYNHFENLMTQEVRIEQLLPLPPIADAEIREHWDYIYEPNAEALLNGLLVRYLESLVYQAYLENLASEHAARMVAMKSASDNADNLINELNLIYNKARQAAITQEISEIVGGAAAV